MNIHRVFLLVFLTFCSQLMLSAQNTEALASEINNAAFDKALEKEDLVILSEINDISISDDRADFMWVTISKKVSYSIQTATGVEMASTFILPESLDPSYISHSPEERNYSHVYSKMRCKYFKGMIISRDSKSYPAEVMPELEEVKMMMQEEEYYGNYKKFIYRIKNLNIGDTLNLEYSYNMPYAGNFSRLSSFRIFFHADLCKRNYRLSISHDPELFFQSEYLNDADPDTVIMEDSWTRYEWNRDNLFGCMDEPGSRPYLSQPHVVFSPMPYDLYYIVPKSFEPRFTPFYSLYAQQREEKHPALTLSIIQGVNTKQYTQIKKFVKQQSKGLDHDTLGAEKIKKMHHTIVDEFAYKDNVDYFNREDIRDPKIGDQIGSKTIRDLCRNDLYLALVLSLDLNYCTTYLSDNRSGEMSEKYFAPMYDNDFLYTVFYGEDHMANFYPKRARFGYYQNEIPFYFENTRARLVHISDYLKKDVPIDEGFREITFPKSTIRDNIRTNRVSVQINVDDLTVDFDAQIYLSGQFSTFNRGLYLYDHQHTKVNERYNKKIWALNEEVVVLDNEVEIRTKEPPFTTQIKAKYKADNLLKKNGNVYALNLENWFNHIIYERFTSESRQMDFYPDFSNRDSYLYYIQFNKDVKMIESIESIEITDEFMNMVIEVEQMSPNSIKIESYFAISGTVEVDKMEILETIFNRLEALNACSLEFVIE